LAIPIFKEQKKKASRLAGRLEIYISGRRLSSVSYYPYLSITLLLVFKCAFSFPPQGTCGKARTISRTILIVKNFFWNFFLDECSEKNERNLRIFKADSSLPY